MDAMVPVTEDESLWAEDASFLGEPYAGDFPAEAAYGGELSAYEGGQIVPVGGDPRAPHPGIIPPPQRGAYGGELSAYEGGQMVPVGGDPRAPQPAIIPPPQGGVAAFSSPGACPPGSERYMRRAQEVGMHLDEQALRSLLTLPEEHAMELLEGTIEKRHTVRNASSYISSTVTRYVPRSSAVVGVKGSGCKGVREPAIVPRQQSGSLSDLAAAGVTNVGRLQQVNMDLSGEAVRALGSLDPAHAAELIDFVCDSPEGTLRDPSNYIVSTVARGFTPRRSAVGDGHGGGRAAAPGQIAIPSHMIPKDATALEQRLLSLNSLDLWQGQQVDFQSFIALRCLEPHLALEVLDGMEHKSRITGITSPCNYVQATVSKILKGEGTFGGGKGGKSKDGKPAVIYPPVGSGKGVVVKAKGKGAGKEDGKNPTGNLSLERATSLGLTLNEQAHRVLANMPLKHAYELLDCTAEVAATGTDPSDYIISCTSQSSDQPLKRARIIPIFADQQR